MARLRSCAAVLLFLSHCAVGVIDTPLEDDAGAIPSDQACSGWAAPDASAACHACNGSSCQPNGCYNGYWCDTTTTKCHATPSGC
jgi:hypothetical protein